MHLSSPGPKENDKPEGPGVANLQRDRANRGMELLYLADVDNFMFSTSNVS